MSSERGQHTLIFLLRRWLYIVLLFGILGGVLFSFIIDQPHLGRLGFILVGPPALAASAFMYINQNGDSISFYSNSDSIQHRVQYINTHKQTHRLLKLFALLYSLSIVTLAITHSRPWYYFLIISIASSITAHQIIYSTDRIGTIIFEISALLLNIIYGVTLNYRLYFGWTDILSHLEYANIVYETGNTLPPEIVHYADFPLYHIFIAQGSHILGVDITTSLYLLTGITFIVSIIFVYVLVMAVRSDSNIALISALFFAIQPVAIFYGTYMITRSMAFVSALIIMFLLFRFNSFRGSALLFIVMLHITLVHQVTIVQFGILLAVLFIIDIMYDGNATSSHGSSSIKLINTNQILLISIIPIIHWMFISDGIIEFLFTNYLIVAGEVGSEISESTGQSPHHYTYYISTYIIIFLSLCGVYKILNLDDQRKAIIIGLFGLITSVLYFPSPLTTLPEASTLRFDRFALLLSPIFAYLMAEGAISVSKLRIFNRTHVTVIPVAVLVIFTLTFSGTALVTSSGVQNAPDVNEFDWTGPPLHFTNDELHGLNSLAEIMAQNSDVYSDWHVFRYYRGVGGLQNGHRTSIIQSHGEQFSSNSYVILRESRINEGLLLGDTESRYVYDGHELQQSLNNETKYYDSNAISGFKL